MLGGKQPQDGVLSPGAGDEVSQAHRLMRDFERAGQGWFWTSNSRGEIVYISTTVADQLGTSIADLVGKPLHSLFTLERDEDETSERTLPLIFGARKTFSNLTIRAATAERELWWSLSGRPQFTEIGRAHV